MDIYMDTHIAITPGCQTIGEIDAYDMLTKNTVTQNKSCSMPRSTSGCHCTADGISGVEANTLTRGYNHQRPFEATSSIG